MLPDSVDRNAVLGPRDLGVKLNATLSLCGETIAEKKAWRTCRERTKRTVSSMCHVLSAVWLLVEVRQQRAREAKGHPVAVVWQTFPLCLQLSEIGGVPWLLHASFRT